MHSFGNERRLESSSIICVHPFYLWLNFLNPAKDCIKKFIKIIPL
jgi:hypothetical protein